MPMIRMVGSERVHYVGWRAVLRVVVKQVSGRGTVARVLSRSLTYKLRVLTLNTLALMSLGKT